jgi:hypothetical protein
LTAAAGVDPVRKKESVMKRSHLFAVAMGLLSIALWCNFAEAKKEAAAGHNVMLVASDGTRWVLIGDGESYKAAHAVRKSGKEMTATLAGEPTTKKDDNGKEYKEVEVSEITIG